MASDSLAGLLDILAPLVEFHQDVKGASESDLRLFWDVRLVRGESETYTSTSGSASLPSVLSPKMLVEAPDRIVQEILDKIARPLAAKLMAEAENQQIANGIPLTDAPTTHGMSQLVAGNQAHGSDEAAIEVAATIPDEHEEEPQTEKTYAPAPMESGN